MWRCSGASIFLPYRAIRWWVFFHSFEDVDLDSPDHHHRHSIDILDSCHTVGRSIGSLKCLKNIRVMALRRNGVSGSGPLLEVEFKAHDVLVIERHADDIQAAEIEIMAGL